MKTQRHFFLENVVTMDDYEYLLRELKAEGAVDDYFLIRFIACTGARVSEVVCFRAEHVRVGYMDLYAKGGKLRRLYIPEQLQKDALGWLEDRGLSFGYIFCNWRGDALSTAGISNRIKKAARRHPKVPIERVYPHSFRHLYAKSFLEKNYDLVLLADLMGHSSFETVRIYARMTSEEQRDVCNKVVTW